MEKRPNQIPSVVLVHGYIRNELDQRIKDLLGSYQEEVVYVVGGCELTVAMTGNHEPYFLHRLYDCLLLYDYYSSSTESYTAYPEKGFEKMFNKCFRITDLPEGDGLLNYEGECTEFVLTAVMVGYDQMGKERFTV